MIKVIKLKNCPQLAVWWLPRQLGWTPCCNHESNLWLRLRYKCNRLRLHIASESHDYDYDYDYLRSCNQLQSITITDYDYPIPVAGNMVTWFIYLF